MSLPAKAPAARGRAFIFCSKSAGHATGARVVDAPARAEGASAEASAVSPSAGSGKGPAGNGKGPRGRSPHPSIGAGADRARAAAARDVRGLRLQGEHRETGQPMRPHVVHRQVREARIQMAFGRVQHRRSAGIVRAAGPRPGPRKHQARLRFSPSRWAILPSVRSVTAAGANRVAGRPAARRGRKRSNQGRKRAGGSRRRMHSASISAGERKSSPLGSPQAGQSTSAPYQRPAVSRSSGARAASPRALGVVGGHAAGRRRC